MGSWKHCMFRFFLWLAFLNLSSRKWRSGLGSIGRWKVCSGRKCIKSDWRSSVILWWSKIDYSVWREYWDINQDIYPVDFIGGRSPYRNGSDSNNLYLCNAIKAKFAVGDTSLCLARYPVILSIENHCSVIQQKKMAQYLTEILGDKLDLSSVHNDDSTRLPSPASLKGKILVKVETWLVCSISPFLWWLQSLPGYHLCANLNDITINNL